MSDWEAQQINRSSDEASSAPDLLETALAAAKSIDNGEEQSEVVEAIAVIYAQRGDLDTAIQLIEIISDPYLKDRACGAVATASIDAGAPDVRDDLLDAIDDPGSFGVAIEQIALKYAERGEFDEALSAASQLADDAEVTGIISVRQAKCGFLDEAVDLARSIESPLARTTTLAQLALEFAEKGRPTDAEDLLAEATEAAEEMATEFPDDVVGELVYVALTYAKLEQRDRALEILLQAKHVCESIESNTGSGITATSTRDAALSQVIEGLAELGYVSEADQTLESIEDPFQFSGASATLALAYHKNQQAEEADELLSQAVEITKEPDIRTENAVRFKDQLFARLAYVYAICGRYDKSFELIEELHSHESKRNLILEIGWLQATAGLDPTPLAELTSDVAERSKFWWVISDGLRQAEQSEQSGAALNRALDTAGDIETKYDQCLALSEIALRFAQRGQLERSKTSFVQALSCIRSIEGNYRKAVALLDLARKGSSLGRELSEEEGQLLMDIGLVLE